MLKIFLDKRGQSTAEYAILIGLVVAVVISMQIYVKRGVQARFKDASDDYVANMSTSSYWDTIGGKSGVVALNQWELDKLSSRQTQNVTTNVQNYTFGEGGAVKRASERVSSQGADDYQQQNFTSD